jgi:hypothetical protein
VRAARLHPGPPRTASFRLAHPRNSKGISSVPAPAADVIIANDPERRKTILDVPFERLMEYAASLTEEDLGWPTR